MALPDNTIIVDEYNDTGNYTIGPMQTKIVPFVVYGTKYTKIKIAHTLFDTRQSFSIYAWFSLTPGGDQLYNFPMEYRAFNLNSGGITNIFYPSENDFSKYQSTFDDGNIDGEFDVEYIEIIKKRPFEPIYRVLRLETVGTYYLNIQNKINSENGFYLNIERNELPKYGESYEDI